MTETVYTLTEAAKVLRYCRETTRLLIKDLPGVYRKPNKAAHYRIPASSLELLKRRLSGARENRYPDAEPQITTTPQ
jgi:hypothetical protein